MLRLLPELCWVHDAAKVAYFSPLVTSARRQRLWIATLNFDNALEAAAAAANVEVDIGLSTTQTAIRFGSNSPIALAKLHGSLNWRLIEELADELDDASCFFRLYSDISDSAGVFGRRYVSRRPLLRR
jgi:hypothetical protein